MSEELKLPRKYLSYSAWSLWSKNRDQFRDRYYEGKKGFSTLETVFGKEIGKMLEDNHGDLAHVPRYSEPEYDISIDIEWDGTTVRILSYLDSFDPEECQILEYKTGHLSKDGSVPWDQTKVENHKQLDWYSMAVNEQHGRVHPECVLVWMETDWMEDFIEYKGRKYSKGKRLKLTGKVEIFKRYIYDWQRTKIKQEIIKAAREISADYKRWLNSRDELLGTNVSQEEPAVEGVLL